MGEKNELRNRSMHIGNEVQSIIPGISKSQIDTLNYTLEEKALLDCIRKNPQIKQQEMAEQIGKSIATVKRLTISLVSKGVIERKKR